MNLVRNLLRMSGAAAVVCSLLLVGCSQNGALSVATDLQTSNDSPISTADLPEVVVTAYRSEPKDIVLTQREPDSQTK